MLLAVAIGTVCSALGAVAIYRVGFAGPHPTAHAVEDALRAVPGPASAASINCHGSETTWICDVRDFNGGESWLPVEVGRDGSVTVHNEFGDQHTCCVQ